MGLYYQTEYRLGRRGAGSAGPTPGCAFLAIAVDLLFLLTFELLFGLFFFLLRNLTRIVGGILLAVFYALSVPFRVAHWVFRQLNRRDRNRVRDRSPSQARLGGLRRSLFTRLPPRPR